MKITPLEIAGFLLVGLQSGLLRSAGLSPAWNIILTVMFVLLIISENKDHSSQ